MVALLKMIADANTATRRRAHVASRPRIGETLHVVEELPENPLIAVLLTRNHIGVTLTVGSHDSRRKGVGGIIGNRRRGSTNDCG